MTEENGKLFRYRTDSPNSTLQYNGILRPQIPGEVITPQDFDVTGVDQRYGELGWQKLVEYALLPFMRALKEDMTTGGRKGWRLLMKYDPDSARSYMTHGPNDEDSDVLNPNGLLPYPVTVIDWIETFHGPTGAYDKALSEAVIDEMFFHWPDSPDPEYVGIQ